MHNVDKDKIVETILAILDEYQKQGLSQSIDIRRISRLMYLVDKTSLEHVARFVSSDIYDATENDGAYPRYTAEIIEESSKTDKHGFQYIKNRFAILRKPNYDELSQSDIETIVRIVKCYGDLPQWHLRQLCRDEAWEKARNTKDSTHWTGRKILVDADDIAICFDFGNLLTEYLHS